MQGASGLKVAMAPEYLFSDITQRLEQTKGPESYQPSSAKSKCKVYDKLETLSKHYRELLIEAGSNFDQKGAEGERV
jgi:hypothetical protein